MSTELYLSKGENTIDLYGWLHGVDGYEALAGILGFGWPDQENRWFEGSGDGATFRGGRILPRDIDLPMLVEGKDRAEVNARLSVLATVLDPRTGPARLSFGMPDNELWFVDVVREGGGNWSRNSEESDNRTYVKFVLTLRAGDPYWTRQRAESFDVRQDDSGRGLLPDLAELQLSDAGAFGERQVENVGDAEAFPIWTANGPFTELLLVGPNGETIHWKGSNSELGSIETSNGLIIDIKRGTVYDFNGENRYDGLEPSPQMWTISPGNSTVSVQALGVTSDSLIVARWRPRRWMVM